MSKRWNEVFVYGTLKRGYNMLHLVPDAKFCDEAIIMGYHIYDLGSYPGVKKTGDRNDWVYGELWMVSDEGLARLDQYEGSGYDKVEDEVIIYDDEFKFSDIWHSTDAKFYLYKGSVSQLKPIVNGKWER